MEDEHEHEDEPWTGETEALPGRDLLRAKPLAMPERV
jgi:hypothetical protein